VYGPGRLPSTSWAGRGATCSSPSSSRRTLRKYGKYTVPQFVGDRYYSSGARVVALLCAILVSFTYVAGQMRGVGIVFARFLGTSVEFGSASAR